MICSRLESKWREDVNSVMMVANTDWALVNFRKNLISNIGRRYESVVCMCSDKGFTDELHELEINELVTCSNYVKDISPTADSRLFLEYYAKYRKIRPTIAHHFTVKPVVYGSIAAKLAGVPIIVNTITGLGYVFAGGGGNRDSLKRIVEALYAVSCRVSDYTWFQNNDDREYFVSRKLTGEKRSGVVLGSGVDLQHFSAARIDPKTMNSLRKELAVGSEQVIVLMVARLLYDKGVAEYVETGKILKGREDSITLLLVGPEAKGNPAMVPMDVVRRSDREGVVRYLGTRRDIRELLHLSDIAALPSYREGTPRFLLEAAAMGKPIISTDVAGCRNVVDEGVNGLLVQPGDTEALSEGIAKLARDVNLRRRMGVASRRKAVMEFDERKIIDETMRVYDLLQIRKGIYEERNEGETDKTGRNGHLLA